MSPNPSSPGKSDGRRERWREHRESRRTDLIAAAMRAVRTGGAGVGMDDIAAAAGVAKPVFYRYFTDKSDLYLEVGRAFGELVVAEISSAIAAEREPRAMLAAGINAYLGTIEGDPELYRFVFGQPLLDRPAPADPVGDYTTVIGLQVTRLIGDLLRLAGLDSGAAEPWGFGLVGLVRAAADRWLEQRSMSRSALAGYLTELVWDGLSAPYRSGQDASLRPRDQRGPTRPRPLKALPDDLQRG